MRFFSMLVKRLGLRGFLQLIAGLVLLAIGIPMLAASNIDFSQIETNLRGAGSHTLGIVGGTSITGGIVFFTSSIFKLHAWKQNPQQVSVGQGIALLIIGVMMVSLPMTFRSVNYALLGASSSINKLGDSRIANIVAPQSLDEGGSAYDQA
jgi:hypothetical protein